MRGLVEHEHEHERRCRSGDARCQQGVQGHAHLERDHRASGLSEGKYSVRARIDVDGNGSLQSGDLDGFTGGTVDAPITDFSKAKEIDVGPSGATGVDFGVAKVP